MNLYPSFFDFLSGGGEMGERIRHFNWHETPLGPPDHWDPSLKTCVRIMLTSAQPICIGWGKDLIKLYNDPYRHIAGKKHPQALGQPAALAWENLWDHFGPLIAHVLETNKGVYLESQLLIVEHKGYSEETYATLSINPIPDVNGKPAGIICYNIPETDKVIHQRAQQTLNQLGGLVQKDSVNEVFASALKILESNSQDFPFAVISTIDRNGLKASANGFAGIDPHHPALPRFVDLQHPGEKGKYLAQAVAENRMLVFHNEGRWNDLPKGPWHLPPRSFVHVPIKARKKKYPQAILTVALNPLRKFDEAYRSFIEDVAWLISKEVNNVIDFEEERKRTQSLAEIDRAKTDFFSNISHEFRTPITLMLGPLEEMLNRKSGGLDAFERHSLQTIHRNGMRLLRLVNSLLDFNRIESHAERANFSLVDLTSFTKNLAANFRSVIEKAGLEFIVQADVLAQPVYIDRQMWEKIVFNLLSNAYKYTLSGKITVSLSSCDHYALLKVSDTGTGIPENELPRIFDRFHRVDQPKGRMHEGTGIGLAMVKELVQLHHGFIIVESTPGKGSTFTVKIPFGKEHLSSQQLLNLEKEKYEISSGIYFDQPEILLNETGTESFTVQPIEGLPTIVVVDDNADMREYLKTLLSKKYNVVTAHNGMNALHKIIELRPHVVLSDIMMPIMDGMELLKAIRNNYITKDIPVILLTARSGEESREAGWNTGVDDYLIKPFSSKELFARIESQIRTAAIRKNAYSNLKSFITQSPVAMAILKGPQYHIEVVNQRMLKIWGRKQDEVLLRGIFDLFPELKLDGFEEIFADVMCGHRFKASEMPVTLYVNGKRHNFYFSFSLEPLRDREGQVEGILVAGMNMTELVNAHRKTIISRT